MTSGFVSRVVPSHRRRGQQLEDVGWRIVSQERAELVDALLRHPQRHLHDRVEREVMYMPRAEPPGWRESRAEQAALALLRAFDITPRR